METRDMAVRAASAAVLAPLTLAALWFGGWAFVAVMALAALVLALEWGRMTEPAARWPMGLAVAAGIMIPALVCHVGDISLALVLLVFGAMLAAALAQRLRASPVDAAYGVFYIGWPLVLLIWLRISDEGGRWTILLFAVTWAADICAYLVGNLFRGPKLWPRFSPNKTWSGFIGGLVGGVAVALVVVGHGMDDPVLHFGGVNLVGAALIGLAGALATMAGDLWESALKRRYGVKDSGAIIPGHGGLLDRVDGLMFAVVVIAAVKLSIDAGLW